MQTAINFYRGSNTAIIFFRGIRTAINNYRGLNTAIIIAVTRFCGFTVKTLSWYEILTFFYSKMVLREIFEIFEIFENRVYGKFGE
jgi:hypothetical protein